MLRASTSWTASLQALLNDTGAAVARERELNKLRIDSQQGITRAAVRARRRRRTRRGDGGRASGMKSVESVGSEQTGLVAGGRLLVFGVVTNPRTPVVRDWIRSTYMTQPAALDKAVLLRFIVGRNGLTREDMRMMRAEDQMHIDVEFIAASDFGERGGIFSCIDKVIVRGMGNRIWDAV